MASGGQHSFSTPSTRSSYQETKLTNPSFNSLQYQQQQRQSYTTPSNTRMRRFKELVNRYEINDDYATCLRDLEGFEIVFIVDDSGSMNTPLVLDPDGVDIYFLNRGRMLHVKDSSELTPAFATPPAGLTPIVRVLREVLEEKRVEIQERKLLILIATDGVRTLDAA
ncbi:unnamed protein product [Didymodactylos carnosus]|uniref:VWFA domain-containing protein n=1 Tax=Didymodactylos carnosus TaxID=1234261 RepID=A0A8S2S2D0_9BILA|nr:unnamed protein product [Didymodactylos carnosus]CAF4197719.1 unnamed protein product [Didymodactylos carnosus]